MSFNAEFVKTRSFEIAWAIFRCADLIKNEYLKKELEKSAVDLITEFGGFYPQVERQSGKSAIDSLNGLIRLAEAVGELNSVNSIVLFRELDNLFNAVQSLSLDLARKEEDKKLKALENIFSKENLEENDDFAEYEVSDLAEPQASLDSYKKNISSAKNESKNKLPDVIFVHAKEEKPAFVNSAKKIFLPKKEERVDDRQKAITGVSAGLISSSSANAKLDSSAELTTSSSAKKEQISSADNDEAVLDSWQDLIYRKIKEVRQVTTKELAGSFPQISERTIRFYLQKLAEAGLVDKKGSTGPGSYYTA